MIRRHIVNVADNKTEELLRYFQRQVYMQGLTLTPWYRAAVGSAILVDVKSHKPGVVSWLPHKMSHNSELTVISCTSITPITTNEH